MFILRVFESCTFTSVVLQLEMCSNIYWQYLNTFNLVIPSDFFEVIHVVMMTHLDLGFSNLVRLTLAFIERAFMSFEDCRLATSVTRISTTTSHQP
jgi:hypothetical protein